jgi:putative photosynthetic complex assembly protein
MAETMRQGVAFPRAALIAGWVLVGGALALATYGSITGMAKPDQSAAGVVAERSLNFSDRADGAVVVTDPAGTVEVVQGQAGFLRGTMRGFARARREQGVGQVPPMILTAYADGRLVLYDPSTKRQVDLEAFGSDNEAVFARLLTLEPRKE